MRGVAYDDHKVREVDGKRVLEVAFRDSLSGTARIDIDARTPTPLPPEADGGSGDAAFAVPLLRVRDANHVRGYLAVHLDASLEHRETRRRTDLPRCGRAGRTRALGFRSRFVASRSSFRTPRGRTGSRRVPTTSRSPGACDRRVIAARRTRSDPLGDHAALPHPLSRGWHPPLHRAARGEGPHARGPRGHPTPRARAHRADFFKEAHVKLRPVEFGTEGVYLCGMAHYPKHIPEAINQAYGAASRALTLLSHDTVTVSGSVCEVKENDCVSCGACITVCTYGAIEFRETPQGRKAWVNPVLCKGDGLCSAKCPTNAIFLKHFTDEELLSQIDAAFPEEEIISV